MLINNSNNNSDNHINLSLIIEKLCIILEVNLTSYIKKSANRKKLCDSIKNLIMLIYIIYYNIRKSEDVILFFKMNQFSIANILIKAIKLFKDDKENISVANFIINICFDDLKRKIYSYKDEKLVDIYQKNVYSEILGIFPSFNEPFNSENKEFSIFMKNILENKLENNIMNLKKENSDIFCQNLIPLLISEPNFDFISFFRNIVNMHIEMIRKQYNNELTSLFRKDDVTNDLIKNLIFSFGNYSFINSFYMLIPDEYLSTNEIIFDLDYFEQFLVIFLTKLLQYLPFIIKVLLNIIKNSIQKINNSEEYYSVVYTVLIFNFYISPSILDLYGISLAKYSSLRQLTRILRNICFGKEFDITDKLSYFNKKIKIYNNFFNENFEKYVFDIDIEKYKDIINKEISYILVNSKNLNLIKEDKSIALPSFCYQYYWENITNVLNSKNNKTE